MDLYKLFSEYNKYSKNDYEFGYNVVVNYYIHLGFKKTIEKIEK